MKLTCKEYVDPSIRKDKMRKYNLKRDIAYITGLLHGYRDALWIIYGALTKQIRAKSDMLDKLKEELEDANS